MKNLLSLIIVLLISFEVSAQIEQRISVLNKYAASQYSDVISDLLKIEQKEQGDFETKILLADSYYNLRDFENALTWFEKATDINHLSEKYNLLYANTLKSNEKYGQADSIYLRYGKRYENLLSQKINIAKGVKYELFNVEMLNTSSDEFSPAYYRDGIAFIGQFIKKKSLYKWNNKPWLRLFYLPYQPKGYENGQVEAFSLSNQVKKNHQGPVAFSRNNQMMYFSQNIKSKRNKISSIGIFTAKKNDGKWKEIQAFELNNPEYSIAHPTLSADGATVFFVSDMPGGYGGTDIYFSKFMNGQWSKPYNIGNVINTPFNEMFPFLHQDGTLYFASEGHAGYGGLDIFYSKYENGKWTKPVNLGKDINSSYDDFGLILDKDKYSGYLSSNRLGGKGGDDIYRIEVENYHQLMKNLQPKDTVSTHNNTENEIYLNSEIVDSEKNIEPVLTVSNHEVATNSLVYKIQLGVFSKVDEKWLEHLKQYGDTEIVQVQGQKTFKVYLLPFYTYRSVSDTLKIIKSKEVKDAFIVAFYNSEVISIEQAKQLEKSK